MDIKMKKGVIFIGRGKYRQDALEDALDGLYGFMLGSSSCCRYESSSVQYEKLPDEKGYECILTAIYTRF